MIASTGLEPVPWSNSQVGQVCGKYHVIAQLGRGGMADVYLAVARGPAGFNKLLVLKQLPPSRGVEPELLTMFLDEASLAARLNHPNVVQVNEVGRDGEKYFIAMEYLDGQPLVRILRRLHPDGLPISVALRVVADACAALHYVHTLADFDGTPLGAVHRDVSPHNLFITYSGHVKLVDFGIAKASNRATDTQVGMLKGKITYMSPEQIHGSDVDGRSDVFALGIVLYETLTRDRMWGPQPQEVDILRRLVNGDVPASPRERAPEVPESVDQICRRALAIDRDARYSSALEMQEDLERVIAALPERASERDIGELVSRLFAEERQTIAAVIERQIRALGSAPKGQLASTSLPTLGVDGVVSVTPSRLRALHQSDEKMTEPTRNRRRILGFIVGGLGILMLLFVWLVSGGEQPNPNPTTASTAPKPSVLAIKPAHDPPELADAPPSEVLPMPEASAPPSPQKPHSPKRAKARASSRDKVKATATVSATSTFGPLDGRK